MKFCRFVASVYPHTPTNFGLFISVINKMMLIFPGVLIVFAVSGFEFQQVKPRYMFGPSKCICLASLFFKNNFVRSTYLCLPMQERLLVQSGRVESGHHGN